MQMTAPPYPIPAAHKQVDSGTEFPPAVGTATELPSEVAVIIIGGGPTGLTAANLLISYGVDSILVLEAREPSKMPRAIMVDDETLRTVACHTAPFAHPLLDTECSYSNHVVATVTSCWAGSPIREAHSSRTWRSVL